MPNNTLENNLEHSSSSILDNINIVMIQTTHTGNIGAAARAMKVMGLSKLYLVNPKSLPDEQSIAMSSNASDVLENAIIVDTLNEAIFDSQLVVGTSARHERSLSWNIQDSRSCAEHIVRHIDSQKNAKVSILFGRESSGLTNEELALCQHLVHIPTNPDYSSLNIASAIQILSYECRLAAINQTQDPIEAPNLKDKDEWVNANELDSYYEHLESTLVDIDFIDPDKPKHLLPRLRRLYSRSGITRSEMNILRGILSSIQKKL